MRDPEQFAEERKQLSSGQAEMEGGHGLELEGHLLEHVAGGCAGGGGLGENSVGGGASGIP